MVWHENPLYMHRNPGYDGEKALRIADEAVAEIRAIYESDTSSKSSNKKHEWGTGWLGGKKRDQETVTSRGEQRTKASDAIGKFRSSMTTPGRAAPTLQEMQGYCYRTTFGDMKATLKGANCGELALLAVLFIRKEKKYPAVVVDIDGANHTICVVGPSTLVSGGLTVTLAADYGQWPKAWAVCDAWANIACLAKDYMTKFEDKMKKWEKDNKKISSGGRWLDPTNSEWINGVRRNQKIIVA